MAFFKVVACLLLAGTALGAPQLGRLVDNFDFNPTGLSAAELEAQMFDPNPQYTYSYQVAADQQQTYIAHEESRDGEAVTGEYSYVDPLGNLITVTYNADEGGYTESRDVQANFVQIRGLPPVEQVISQAVSSGNRDSDLVGNIISQLTPFIKNTVSTSLGSGSPSSSALGSSRTVASAPATRTRLSSFPDVRASLSATTPRRTVVSSTPVSSFRPVVSSTPVSSFRPVSLPSSSRTLTSSSLSSFPSTSSFSSFPSSSSSSLSSFPSSSSRTVLSAAPVTTTSLVSSVPASSSGGVSSIFGTGGANNFAFASKDFDFNVDLE